VSRKGKVRQILERLLGCAHRVDHPAGQHIRGSIG
jgi:hypothetical protein